MKDKKSKPTVQERIAKYLEAVPPAIAYSRGHDQTFKVACSLYNGWNLSEEDTLAWLRIYNQRCQPPWTDKELAHKAAEAAKAEHNKPRGHLLDASIEQQRAEPDWTLPSKPITSGKIPATLATLNSNLRACAYNIAGQPSACIPVYLHARKSENNVANVAKTGPPPLAGPETCPNAEKMANEVPAEHPNAEHIDWFLKDLVIRENGALCAFHYLFARYRKWRASFGLLATKLTQEQFAFAVQSHGIKTDFDRKLFFDARARWEDPAKPAPASENRVAKVADSPQ